MMSQLQIVSLNSRSARNTKTNCSLLQMDTPNVLNVYRMRSGKWRSITYSKQTPTTRYRGLKTVDSH